MRSCTLSTSSFTFEADIGAYFISKLPCFYAKRLEHIFAEDKEIIEFLEKKADEVSNMEHDRFHCDLIVIKAPHDNCRIKCIKGIGQQALIFGDLKGKLRAIQVTCTSGSTQLNMIIGAMKFNIDDLLQYEMLKKPFLLTVNIIYNVPHYTKFEDFKNIINLFFGEDVEEESKTQCRKQTPIVESFNCNLAMVSNPEFHQYLIRKLSGSWAPNLKLTFRKAADVFECLNALKSNSSIRKIELDAFTKVGFECYLDKVNELYIDRKNVHISMCNTVIGKSLLSIHEIEIV